MYVVSSYAVREGSTAKSGTTVSTKQVAVFSKGVESIAPAVKTCLFIDILDGEVKGYYKVEHVFGEELNPVPT